MTMIVAMANVRVGQQWRRRDPEGDGFEDFEVTGFQRGPGVPRVQGKNVKTGKLVRVPLSSFKAPAARLELLTEAPSVSQ